MGNQRISTPSFADLSIGSASIRSLSQPDGDMPYGSISQHRDIAQDNQYKQRDLHTRAESNRRATEISMLPDDALLDIFDFYRNARSFRPPPVWKWHILAHVCQRWRQVVFTSPHRLKLQILCTHGTPVRKNLDIWPAFPIVLDLSSIHLTPNDEDIVITTLERPNRIRSVRLSVTGLQLGKIVTLMQEPFPLLTQLIITASCGNIPVLPVNFLGESAPCLQEINLYGIPYPALPKLLLSTSNLITLTLCRIPPTGYISPETMIACLAALPRLERFTTEFQSAIPHADQIRPPPVTRAFLPALTSFRFQGASEYLENLVAHMDSPQLSGIFIISLDRPVDFQVAQLSMFVDRSVGPDLTPSRRAHVCFHGDRVTFTLYRHGNYQDWDRRHHVVTTILSESSDWEVFHRAEVLSRFSASLHTVAHLKVDVQLEFWEDRDLEGEDNVDWLHLFHQFPALQTLHVSRHLAHYVALALDDATGELPSLDLICLEGQPTSTVEKLEFVAARRLSGRPVTVVNKREAFDKRLKSYISKRENTPYQ